MKGNSIPENLWKPNHFVAMLPLEQVPQETAEYSKSTAEVHWDDRVD
jgi:hypothetical protein